MPLILIDYLREDFGIDHGGLLRKYLHENLSYVEGQVLEVYEGWLGREKVRTVNLRLTARLSFKRIYMPRETCIRHGIIPRTWIVFSVSRVGDPRREYYVPIYEGRVFVHVPRKDIIYALFEELFFKGCLIRKPIGFIYRFLELRRELKKPEV
ncbi:MAG: hypothetical protein QXT47_02530 [Desulfurococcaceae archaeon]